VGQNISAYKAERIFRALALCAVFCLGSGIAIALGLALMHDFLPALFSSSPTVTDVAGLFLLIAPVSYGAYGMVMVMNASFNGMGKPMPAVVISVARMAAIYVPLAFIGQHLFGVAGIFAAYAIANIVTAVIAYVWARASVHEQCDRHREPVLVPEAGPL
jgi:Na+-driven multidrug efflux pump